LGTRAFLITGRGRAECEKSISERVDVTTFRLRDADPDIEAVDSAAASCAEAKCDCVIGLGQGGVIDTAKLVSMVRGHGADSVRPFVAGERRIEMRGLPLMAVPLAAVTGAEITSTAFVIERENKVRWGLSHPYLVPESVIIDPELTLSAPAGLTAAAGVGAFAFALEAFVSVRSNEITDRFALESIRLIGRNLRRAVRDVSDVEAKTGICLAAYLAGAAATGTGPGVAGVIAPALQMALGTGYGEAVAIVLPASIEFNLDHAREKYARVAEVLASEVRPGTEDFPDLLAALYDDIGISDTIARIKIDYGMIEETLNSIAESGARAEANPRPVDRAGLVRILRHAREYVQRRSASR
jgi:alcohol dehydrogenase class IV